jgi:hypothetical protein
MPTHVMILVVVLIALAAFWKEALAVLVVGAVSLPLLGMIEVVTWLHLPAA